MAPNFLVLARKAIVEALDLTSGKNEQLLKLNKRQCKCVAQKLSETREILKYVESAAGSANSLERRDATLGKELYRVVTDALLLIKKCRGEQWLRAAIRQRSEKNSEDFVEICSEVQWCTSVLCICLQSAIRKQAAVVEPEAWDGRLSVLDHFKLEAAANQDREDLKSSLKLLSQGHVCDASCARSKAEKCLAAQFFKRLDSRPTELAADRGSRSAEILPSLLWKVHYRDLPSVRKIGKGSFGEVQETKWLEDKYAKKVFPGADNKSFKQESEVLARLCHPNVVRVVGWSENRNGVNASIIMELMREDLFKFLRNCRSNNESKGSADVPLSILAAVDILLQVARGLKYLHSRHVVHRDVKSLNVLVKHLSGVPELEYSEGYLNAKLADFGLSKTKNSSTRYSNQTPNVGTRKWMAPEVFEITKDKIDSDAVQVPETAHPFKADVYSFAIVCYEILTGKEPFEGERDLYKRITLEHARPKLPKICPGRLVSLIRRCWKHDPLSRPYFPEICKELRYIKGLLLTGTLIAFSTSYSAHCYS
jgi:serine/threonine protein kinase